MPQKIFKNKLITPYTSFQKIIQNISSYVSVCVFFADSSFSKVRRLIESGAKSSITVFRFSEDLMFLF